MAQSAPAQAAHKCSRHLPTTSAAAPKSCATPQKYKPCMKRARNIHVPAQQLAQKQAQQLAQQQACASKRGNMNSSSHSGSPYSRDAPSSSFRLPSLSPYSRAAPEPSKAPASDRLTTRPDWKAERPYQSVPLNCSLVMDTRAPLVAPMSYLHGRRRAGTGAESSV